MSKKIRLRALSHIGLRASAFFIALAILFSLLSFKPATGARAQSAAATASANSRSAAIAAATEDVLRETSQIRELPILNAVKSGAQTRSEIERMVIKNLDDDTTPAEMHASELAMKKLGIVPSDFEFRPFLISLLTEQVAGYYDPRARQFYLADWIDLDGQKPVMAHELTHALQDQHFNLQRFEKWPKGDSDAELAAHALIEGDATLVMTIYMMRDPLRALAFMKSLEGSESSSEQINKAPRALRESLLFPYEQGSEWVTYLYKREGWKRITAAFADLPQSTEQILHPEKYLARETPIKIDLPDIHNALGANWKRIDYDVNGEWSYYLILDQFLMSVTESKQAAAGWGGDRYEVYEDTRTGNAMLAQLSAWDTERDAQEFFDAYAKRTARRYAGATQTDTVDSVPITRRAWRTTEGNVIMERRGSRVLIMEGVPESADAKALAKTLWQ